MRWIGLVAVAAALSSPPTTATKVVHWSPLTAAGTVKPTLKVHDAGTGRCSDTYTTAGDIAYRCGRGHFLYFPCWRQGPSATDPRAEMAGGTGEERDTPIEPEEILRVHCGGHRAGSRKVAGRCGATPAMVAQS